ncbi:MAG: hydroxyisourate hydrolase [Alphaproteobacteria bacterium]|nr:hydroxyisourate hydrolase [Alphaproteobacteria bacterium]
MTGLTTHVLDTSNGRPAAGMTVELWRRQNDGEPILIKTVTTNADGRTDGPLLTENEVASGAYELRFHVAAYFQSQGTAQTAPPFLDIVPVVFSIADTSEHFHVPLLVSPWSYATYRGS